MEVVDVVVLWSIIAWFLGLVPRGWSLYHVMLLVAMGASFGGFLRSVGFLPSLDS